MTLSQSILYLLVPSCHNPEGSALIIAKVVLTSNIYGIQKKLWMSFKPEKSVVKSSEKLLQQKTNLSFSSQCETNSKTQNFY